MEFFHRLFLACFFNGVHFCRSKICLTWFISDNVLSLSCKTDNLYHNIIFYDPTGKEQAGCLVSFPEPPVCFRHSLFRKGNVTQIVPKLETIFTIPIENDKNVLGIWTCQQNNDKGMVKVTLKPVKEIATPYITSNQSLPFPSETVVKLICTVDINQNTVEIQWDCLRGNVFEGKIDNCTTYISIFTLRVTLLDDGKLCKCVARTNFMEKSSVLKIRVRDQLTLELPDHVVCNESSQISITCAAHGNPSWYRFSTWIHTYKNTYLRHINGTIEGNISSIHIQACRFEDMGNYTCRLFSTKNDEKLIIKSAILKVKGSPVIVKTLKDMTTKFTLSAIFLSFPPPFAAEWYAKNERITNSSKYIQQTSNQLIILQMYGKQVVLDGYVANISVNNGRPFTDTISVVLQNGYGNSTYKYSLPDGRRSFHIRSLLLVLFLISAVIFAVVVTTFLATKISRTRSDCMPERDTDMLLKFAP